MAVRCSYWKNNDGDKPLSQSCQTYWFAQDSPGFNGAALAKMGGSTRTGHVLVSEKCPLFTSEAVFLHIYRLKFANFCAFGATCVYIFVLSR